jgi:hypothetical protein
VSPVPRWKLRKLAEEREIRERNRGLGPVYDERTARRRMEEQIARFHETMRRQREESRPPF